MNHKKFNTEEKLDIFKQVFFKRDWYKSDFIPYKIGLEEKHYNLFYKEINGQEKILIINEHQKNGFNYDSEEIVECIHCGEKFKFKDVKVIKELDGDNAFVVCKNHPRCDGSIIDLIHVEEDQ